MRGQIGSLRGQSEPDSRLRLRSLRRRSPHDIAEQCCTTGVQWLQMAVLLKGNSSSMLFYRPVMVLWPGSMPCCGNGKHLSCCMASRGLTWLADRSCKPSSATTAASMAVAKPA